MTRSAAVPNDAEAQLEVGVSVGTRDTASRGKSPDVGHQAAVGWLRRGMGVLGGADGGGRRPHKSLEGRWEREDGTQKANGKWDRPTPE